VLEAFMHSSRRACEDGPIVKLMQGLPRLRAGKGKKASKGLSEAVCQHTSLWGSNNERILGAVP
jgi:hypothetical protein